jgi:nucleotide-binding universal stress UspA family protein
MVGPVILVGVDGSPSSLAAVDLAVGEARSRGLPLRLVYGDPWAGHPAWAQRDGPDREPLPDPEAALVAATSRAEAAGAGGVRVIAEILSGDPAAVLIRESAGAALAVVGHRGRGGFPDLLLGSVADKLAGHAGCPVVVTGRAAMRAGGEVVVGVDRSQAAYRAVGFAFEEARLRGVCLHAIRAWTGPRLAGPTGRLGYDPLGGQRREEQICERAVAGWRERFPQTPVRTELCWDTPARALLAASGTAQLVVLGARGAGGLPGRRLGAAAHALLHHAGCPVAVVPGAGAQQP